VPHDYEVGIIEAARQSTQGNFRGWGEDAKLLKRLYDYKHATPFEFAGLIIEVQAPITVFREWHRHRTQGYSEASARYTMLPDLYYLPDEDDVFARGNATTKNRQAQGLKAGLLGADAQDWLQAVEAFYARAEQLYQMGGNIGIPKELARLVMPVGHYSKMRAVGNLRNWLAFMTLRCAPDAQKEIRLFANALGEIIQALFPRTYQLWLKEPRVRCENNHAPILHAEGACPLCAELGLTEML
jgi:thymidylate synthase (FAD)